MNVERWAQALKEEYPRGLLGEREALVSLLVGKGLSHAEAVEVARALALSPKLLLLDEPMAGMTLEEKEDMVRFILEIRARGTTVVLIEHDLGVVMDISDRVYVLDFGQVIAEGRPEEVARNPRVQEAYMGVEV